MSRRPAWKNRETKEARQLGAERNIGSGSLGRADRSCSDSTHKQWFLEVKLRARHSAVTLWRNTAKLAKKEGKTPVVALCETGMPGTWYVVHKDHVEALAAEIRSVRESKKEPLPGQASFLEEAGS